MDAALPSRRDIGGSWGAPTRLVALTVGRALALLPRRLRFRAVVTVARITAPLVTALLSLARYSGLMKGRIDATVRVLCRAMIAAGTQFDPQVRYDGPEDLSGALLVSGHFPLNALVTRSLFDRGMPPAVVKRFPLADPCYWGSSVRDHVFAPSPTILVKVRKALAEGRPVFIDIDTMDDVRRGFRTATPYGVLSISTAVFDFARRLQIPLYFACGRSERRGMPLVYIRRIEPTAEAFLRHYQEQGAQIV